MFLQTKDAKQRSRHHAADRLHYVVNRGLDSNCMVRNLSLKMTLDRLTQELRDELQLENGVAELDNPISVISTAPSRVDACVESNNASTDPPVSKKPVTASEAANANTSRGNTMNTGSYTSITRNDSTGAASTIPSRRTQKSRMPYEGALLSLTKLLEKHEVEEQEYGDMQDWRQIAQIVDRIMFVFFLVATITSTLAVLVVVPATQTT